MVNRFLFKDRDGQTPLPHELQKGLKPKNIQTMAELDEYEEQNIAKGLTWLEKYKGEWSTYEFWITLHKRLFSDVWEWAGKVRQHELNNPDFHSSHQIWPALKQLEGDVNYWLKNKSFSNAEVAARFHERIETIHPFANGNGRFGRILIEYFCKKNGHSIPTWGLSKKDAPKDRRKGYIAALDHARRTQDYNLLVDFMFS